MKKRDDNKTYGVTHCWPIKYNDEFRKKFEIYNYNPDESRFSPRAAAEMVQCMARLFPRRHAQAASVLRNLGCGMSAEDELESKLLYAMGEQWNDKTVLVGSVPELIAYLRARPALRQYLGIVHMLPFGFVAGITVQGEDKGTK